MAITVFRAQAGGPELARFVVHPVFKVLCRERGCGRHARGAAGVRDVDNVALGNEDEITKRQFGKLALAQNLLVDKGEAPDIVRAFDLVRLHASRVETGAVIRRILLSMDQVFLQQTQFQDISPDAGLRFKRRVPVFWITGRPMTLDCA